jgi:hypothetical protein
MVGIAQRGRQGQPGTAVRPETNLMGRDEADGDR